MAKFFSISFIVIAIAVLCSTIFVSGSSLRGAHTTANQYKIQGALSTTQTIDKETHTVKNLKVEHQQERIKTIDGTEDDQKRHLGAESLARLFSTPIGQWTIHQWIVVFILIWLLGYFLRCCPCIYDILACFCCYELFCDPNPGGFFLF
mmetsp:Transcript_8137/g.10340  ORF Transcript_8137/g.10340 Transcript_8137/m.10340 type:complete len:149 (-) Transcript_8137:349-795(-)